MASWKEELQSRMKNHAAGKETSLLCFDIIDSTNEEAKRRARKQAPEGLFIVADAQEQGKGRRGREWESPGGENLYLSVLLRPDFKPEQASMVTLVAAFSTAKVIRMETGLDAMIKWPNDIVIGGRKAVGILTELSLTGGDIESLVCGIGMNVNQTRFPESICETATSLCLELGEAVDRTTLLSRLIGTFWADYRLFARSGDFACFQEEYQSLLVNLDRQVRVLDPKGEYTGVARGINEKGELLVEKEDGSVEAVYAGEVSVRGIYGYV